jgi:hypothetical protein
MHFSVLSQFLTGVFPIMSDFSSFIPGVPPIHTAVFANCNESALLAYYGCIYPVFLHEIAITWRMTCNVPNVTDSDIYVKRPPRRDDRLEFFFDEEGCRMRTIQQLIFYFFLRNIDCGHLCLETKV